MDYSLLLLKIKTSIRLTTAAFDEYELIPLIDACIVDLKIAGVTDIDLHSPAIERAVILYCKANFGLSEDMEQMLVAYERYRDRLALYSG